MKYPVRYSVIIPVYNSTESLEILCERLLHVFTITIKETFELIFIDDGSPRKQSWETIQTLTEKYNFVKGIQLRRNFGKNGALICGFEKALGEFVITMDDDLQHFPEDISELIRYQEHDIVIGSFRNKEHSFSKKIFSRINSYFEEKLLGKPKGIRSSPFRLFQSEVVKEMIAIKTAYPNIPALMYYVTRDVVNAEVNHGKRKFDQGGFTIGKMWKSFSNMLINNSSFLLKLIAGLGIIISLISFLLGVFFLVKKLTVGTSQPGWASLMVTLLFIGGLILFSIGVVGEYLVRIINGTERKPAYIIKKRTSDEV